MFGKPYTRAVELDMEQFTLSLTFDDVLLRPGYSSFDRADISLQTKLTKKLALRAPFVSAPMDTVTEARLVAHELVGAAIERAVAGDFDADINGLDRFQGARGADRNHEVAPFHGNRLIGDRGRGVAVQPEECGGAKASQQQAPDKKTQQARNERTFAADAQRFRNVQ